MTPATALALVGVGFLAGVVSVVVSLASVISYPALLALGLPPVAANVTNTVSLVFSGIGAAAGSRPELRGLGRGPLRLGAVAAVGGAAGAGLLLLLPASTFAFAVPLLVAGASGLILAQPVLARARGPAASGGRRRRVFLLGALVAASAYVGYFGAAGGVLLLAVLSELVVLPLVRTNAVKNVVAGMANAVAAVAFVLVGPVYWPAVPPLALGFLAGGWVGPSVARRVPAPALRRLIAGCGLAVAAVLAARTYG